MNESDDINALKDCVDDFISKHIDDEDEESGINQAEIAYDNWYKSGITDGVKLVACLKIIQKICDRLLIKLEVQNETN